MLDPAEFIRSIYLGDRACKSFLVDGWAAEIKMQIDSISRVRAETWNYYQAEDLENGFIVFEGVRKVVWDGKLPNDVIQSLAVSRCETGEAKYIFHMEISSWNEKEQVFSLSKIDIYAESIALEAQVGGLRIRD